VGCASVVLTLAAIGCALSGCFDDLITPACLVRGFQRQAHECRILAIIEATIAAFWILSGLIALSEPLGYLGRYPSRLTLFI
jgi:hypothetical protein